MKIRISKDCLLPIAFFLLTIQNANFFIDLEINDALKYTGIFVLLIGCTISFFRMNIKLKKQQCIFLLCVILLCAGLIKQELAISRVIYLCISNILLAYIAIFPNSLLTSFKAYKNIAKAILLATAAATVLSLLSGISIVTLASEGLLVKFGFNGGVEHRNYYSYSMLGCFILYDLDKTIYGKKKDRMLIILFLLMLIGNSRSVLIVFMVYYVIAHYRKWHITGMGRKTVLSLILFLMILVGIPAYRFAVLHSETFFFRINGLFNYQQYVTGDIEHIIFGNAKMAFAETGMTYDQNIRSVIGWNGSVELAFLNVMIKSGVLGVIAFVILFVNIFKKTNNMKWQIIESRTYAILISFLVSSFVEAYVGTLNLMYSPLCYTLLATLPYMQENGQLLFRKIRKKKRSRHIYITEI